MPPSGADQPRRASNDAIRLILAEHPHQMALVRTLFSEYAAHLNVDLCFQDFEHELQSLPGEYGRPRGGLWLALVGEHLTAPETLALPLEGGRWAAVAGCCAMRPMDAVDHVNAAEMKRLYVRPAFRGMGLGRVLAESVLDSARQDGYSCLLLDTLDDMEAARGLYEDLGFFEVPPYYHNPIAGAHYLKVLL